MSETETGALVEPGRDIRTRALTRFEQFVHGEEDHDKASKLERLLRCTQSVPEAFRMNVFPEQTAIARNLGAERVLISVNISPDLGWRRWDPVTDLICRFGVRGFNGIWNFRETRAPIDSTNSPALAVRRSLGACLGELKVNRRCFAQPDRTHPVIDLRVPPAPHSDETFNGLIANVASSLHEQMCAHVAADLGFSAEPFALSADLCALWPHAPPQATVEEVSNVLRALNKPISDGDMSGWTDEASMMSYYISRESSQLPAWWPVDACCGKRHGLAVAQPVFEAHERTLQRDELLSEKGWQEWSQVTDEELLHRPPSARRQRRLRNGVVHFVKPLGDPLATPRVPAIGRKGP